MMKVKITPDLLLLGCGACMWFIARLLPQCSLMLPYNTLLCWPVLLAGLLIAWKGIRTLHKQGTTTRPDRGSLSQAATLVTTGIYKYTRNPVYLGMAVMLFAWAIFLENWAVMPVIIIFITFITWLQIIPEEKALQKIFGNKYAAYKKQTRRWL